ncbi:DUF2249 domain-containing protein [Pseudonocardia asaccharolytica]|uniref:Cation-binding protein n=1 Tax=Pseudonocardia asaccharolytica DSM 44247 = NBRC 16224 TaxID=1123024 RepID=A0A511D7Z6_9PSEU|nr:DUF2249 domain-containing protein [Pseudonocardia asaccharolytica]GEL20921.1 hypothetical protein PA7_47580 [Pseudonocardia asaccharolytica DSM 44247 = NBRC 16224]
MNNVVIASNEADAAAVAAVEQHHAELAGALNIRVETLLTAVAGEGATAAGQARRDLVAWCNRELVPHALAEEKALYPAAREKVEGRLLVDAMLDEHRVITGLVEEVSAAPDLHRAGAAAHALRVLFGLHLTKENEQILPLLAAAPDVAVTELLAGMHELLGAQAETGHGEHTGSAGHDCGCGEVDGPGYPELDARAIPHAIRHATIFGALDTVRPGRGLVLVAPHDPLPLLAQIERRTPGLFAVDYLERGPEAWRLRFVRSA